jgi:surface protein
MILEYNTALSDGTTITLPLKGTVNVTVNWGDGNSDIFTTVGNKTHTYAIGGIYTVSLNGTLTGFGSIFYTENNLKLTRVLSFGNIGLTDLGYAFLGSDYLTELPTNIPASVNDTRHMFEGCQNFNNSNICYWDVSNVTDMKGMFYSCTVFNQNISTWEVSNVTNMTEMFSLCDIFNQNIGNWNVSNVTDMSDMFNNCFNFNQNISIWDVSSVTDMTDMFYDCNNFNQNIGNWDVNNVTDMSRMFFSCDVFNQNIGNWDVSSVTNMSWIFADCISFNQDISNWDVSCVTDMSVMFSGCSNFNQEIGNWDVGSVHYMSSMFFGCSNFNQDIGNWNVSNVTRMESMFSLCHVFNKYIGNWDVSNVIHMESMFRNCYVFNKDIGNWDVSNVTNMSFMFLDCEVFNQDIGYWDVSNVTNMSLMFKNTTLSTENYDALLNGWSSQTLKPNVTFEGGYSKYSCYGEAARNILTGSPNNWNITDGGITTEITPTITCPANQTINLLAGQTFYTVPETQLDPLYADDNCQIESIINNFNSLSTLNGAEVPIGTTTIIWTVTDIDENSAQCSFDVTVNGFNRILDLHENKIVIYPNPADGMVYINFTKVQNFGKVSFEIFDNSGKLVYSAKAEKEIDINTSNWSSGVYLVKIDIDGKEPEIEKLIIE